MRRVTLFVVVCAIAAASCSHLGLGTPTCLSPDRGVSAASVLTIQAVPSAKYTPCIRETRVGWDTMEWFAEDGKAGIKFARTISPFLTATVTESCDVSGAIEVESGFNDIDRYEDVESVAAEIAVTVIPSSQRALTRSRQLVASLDGTDIDGRPVMFTIDENVDEQVGPRMNLAFLYDSYVWVMTELDSEEGTVELRGENLLEVGRGLTPARALDMIDDNVPDVSYVGSWYFTFEGGCITYDFNAKGDLAETIAEDAEEVFGFYPARAVTEMARDAGLMDN